MMYILYTLACYKINWLNLFHILLREGETNLLVNVKFIAVGMMSDLQIPAHE